MSPVTARDHVPSFSVLVSGAEIDRELGDRITEIRVDDHLTLPDTCFLQLKDESAERIDGHPFEVGETLEIRLGAREMRAPASLFKGAIVANEPSFGAGGVRLGVRAYDRSHVLHRSRHVRTFQNQTSSDIVAKLVGEAGLTAECEPSGEPHEFVGQDNETDWDFIWRLARNCGFEFRVEDTTGHFAPAGSTSTTVALEWPGTLRSFTPRVTAAQQAERVTVRAHDPLTKSVIEATASTANGHTRTGTDRDAIARTLGSDALLVSTSPVGTRGEAEKLAQATLDRLANAFLEADGVAQGTPEISAGVTLELTGLGTRFSGTYVVGSSSHVLRSGAGGYETRFCTATGAARTLGDLARASGRPRRFGDDLVLGLVTNNHDPEALGRVRVSFPALSDDDESAWARVATPSAGAERGLLMLPVPGEEVLVGFEHGDTRRPYVLGSLFNGRDVPGERLANRDGSFAVRSDHDVDVTALGKLTTEIEGDVKHRVGGGQEHTIGSDLSVTADRDITIRAPRGKLVIQASSIELKADTTVAVDGMTVDLKAKGQATLEGTAGANVKGAIVNLG